MFKKWFLVLCLVLFKKQNATILRLPCLIYADFSVSEVDKVLKGTSLQSFSGIGDIGCTAECAKNPKCRSYNIKNDESDCILKQVSLGKEGTFLTSAPGWTYRSTDYNNTLVGTTCETLDPCKPGILCKDTCTSPFYECVYCDESHYGLHCDHRKDSNECAKNPCKNGGTCEDLVRDYRCICKPGFTGKRCAKDLDECASNPCSTQYAAGCKDLPGDYKCICKAGFTGKSCDKDINECDNNPCQNGGTCHNSHGSYSCTCAPNYYLNNCQGESICSTKPCMHDGQCILTTGYPYVCACKWSVDKYYYGNQCQFNAPGLGPCASTPCMNGGFCIMDSASQNQFKCICLWKEDGFYKDITTCSS